MDKEKIKSELKSASEEIAEQVKIISNYNQSIPRIELDILMQNVRNLYEQLHQLSKWNDSIGMVNKVESIVTESAKEEIAVAEPLEIKMQEIVSARQEIFTAAEVVKELEEVIPEEIKIEKMEVVVADAIVRQEEVSVKSNSKKPVQAKQAGSLFEDYETLGDKFEEQPTIHDKISKSKEEQSVIEKLNLTPVSDLKKAIGINEKFGFINDLFDGSLSDYSSAIESLNSLTSFEEAERILNTELSAKLNNKRDSHAYTEFYQLIKRRYLS